jgi:hypothetical protein
MGTRVKTLLWIPSLVACAAAAVVVACEDAEPTPEASSEAEAPSEPEPAPEPEPDLGPPRRVFAKRFVANVRQRPDPEARRLGYMRGGATSMTTSTEPVAVDEECDEGWFELETGGFVCNGRDVIVFDGERLPEVRATQPDLDADLPYQYAYARRDNVAVYRGLPTDEEAAEFEGYVIPGSEPPPEEEVDAGAAVQSEDSEEATPAGIGGVEEEATEAVASADDAAEGEEEEEEEPEDAGPPTLRDLRANRHSILMRRMMRGFYVSLDRDFRANRRRYWRTQQHEFIPYRMLNLKTGSEFQGLELGPLATVRPADTGSETEADADPETEAGTEVLGLPVGWVLSRDTSSYRVTDDGRVRRNARKPGYHHSFHIVGEHEYRGTRYFLGDDENAYRERDITIAELIERPDDVAEDEKWIDVNLSDQTLVAYEGDTPVYATLVSTGIILREGVPGRDHRTPPGRYRIRAKHLATTMDGYNAFDGAYSIEDVPYVMYYEAGYALHSAFWHNLFGRTKSHGCVNLSPRDAKWMFGWTEPALPEGWHGVYPEDPEEGTLIVIRGETPQRRRRR